MNAMDGEVIFCTTDKFLINRRKGIKAEAASI